MRRFREKLRDWAYPRLLRIYFWLQKSAFKKAIALRGMCTLVLDFEIRNLEPSFLQIGEIDSDDALVEYASRTLTQRQMIDGVENAAHMRSELAAKLIEQSRLSDSVREVVAMYFLADAFMASLLSDDVTRDVCLGRAREFSPDVKPLDASNLYKASEKVKKRYWALRRELAERSAIKVEVSLSSVVSLIGVASAILIVAGYLYTTVLLDAFGIDASIFFSLPDYLAASLEQLRNAGYSAAIGLVFFVLGVRESSLRSKLEHRARLKQQEKEDVAMLIVIVSCAIAITLGAYRNQPSFFALEILSVFIAYWLAGKIANMFFKKPLSALIFVAVVFVFAAHAGVRLYQQVYDLKNGIWESDALKISLKVPMSVSDGSLVIITANSSFVFALCKEDKSVYVIPRDNVKQFKVSNRL